MEGSLCTYSTQFITSGLNPDHFRVSTPCRFLLWKLLYPPFISLRKRTTRFGPRSSHDIILEEISLK